MRKIWILLPVIGLPTLCGATTSLFSCGNGKNNPIPTGITLNKTELDLSIGDTFQLVATIIPEGAPNEVVWQTNNPLVATVDLNGMVTAKANGNATITVSCVGYPNVMQTCTVTVETITAQSFETCDWSYLSEKAITLEKENFSDGAISSFCNSFTLGDNPTTTQIETKHTPTSLEEFMGYEKTATLNDVTHRIRCVAYQHDEIVEGELTGRKAAFTFEFANVISDANGALASFWLDVATPAGANINYLNSTLRYNLVKEGTGSTHKAHTGTQWYGCDNNGDSQTTHRTGALENTSVLEMIQTGEPELYSALKSTKQYVATTTKTWTDGQTSDTEYYDKIFLPAVGSYGYINSTYTIETKPTTYQYYLYENTKADQDGGRLKHAVGISSEKKSQSEITDALYTNSTYNYAGYTIDNTDTKYTKEHLGTGYWLSSPFTNGTQPASCISTNGETQVPKPVFSWVQAIAPAFCI